MTQTVVDIHVLPHSQSTDNVRAIIMNALQLGFEDATHNYTSADADDPEATTDDSDITLTVTVEYDGEDHNTETAVRTALENMIADAPIHVEATEINHKASPTRALPAPDSN